jgi:hypothetical protein
MTKVDKKHMRKRYEDDSEFRGFVKEAIAISHLPPEQLKTGFEHLENDFNFEDDKAAQFKIEFLDYISTYWINGCYPPRVWLSYNRGEDLTNNNQEGFNSKINKKLKQINPSPGLLLLFIYDQLNAAEVKAFKTVVGNAKPRKEKKQQIKAKSRDRLKRNLQEDLKKENVNKKDIIKDFLAAMAHNIVSSTMSGKKACDSKVNSKDRNEVIKENEGNNDISSWNNHDDSNILDITKDGNDPYSERQVGVSKKRQEREVNRESRWWIKEKCKSCGKGFRPNSKVNKCHACDRYTHIKKPCTTSNKDGTNFYCVKCKEVEKDAATYEETLDSRNFQCQLCKFSFNHKRNLIRHMKQ